MRRVVLLDIDGTLVDSNQLHAEAWHAAFALHGFLTDVRQLRRMIGMGGDKVLPSITGLADDDPRAKQISATRSDLFMHTFLPRVQALPGARELIQRILQRGLRPVVASSANERELNGLLARGNLSDLLSLRTGSDDAASSKPDPDIVQAALRKCGARPSEAVLLGDTPYDLEAATRAGVGFVGVRSGGYGDTELGGALAVYQDVADLLARFAGSPLVG